ncbi:MAG: UbiX family flavin prenyltransferase [Dehalococcoidales bacterium]|nr:UbiX family flavin prenyltransferase [Dehalococcoidales bacterium]
MAKKSPRVLIVGMSGASGAIHGIRLLEMLAARQDVETHLVISKAAEINIKHETSWKVSQVKALANFCYDIDDIGASLASGSFKSDGMVIIPCSIKTLSAVANSYSDNLLSRAADVTLKERRRLVLAVRETPLHLGHLRNMTRVTETGAIVFPLVTAFYNRPQTIQELIDHTVGRILDLLGLEHSLVSQWSGIPGKEAPRIK